MAFIILRVGLGDKTSLGFYLFGKYTPQMFQEWMLLEYFKHPKSAGIGSLDS